jgi:hypothetical protein
MRSRCGWSNRCGAQSFLRQVAMEEPMPAKSKKQQMAAGIALAAKRGEKPKSELRGPSKQMVQSMDEGELEKMARTPRKKLPTRKSKTSRT